MGLATVLAGTGTGRDGEVAMGMKFPVFVAGSTRDEGIQRRLDALFV